MPTRYAATVLPSLVPTGDLRRPCATGEEVAVVSDPNYRRLMEPSYALVYAAMVPVVQRVAYAHGYAVAVHGSMATDLDLLACPWTDEATDADTLIKAIQAEFGAIYHTARTDPNPAVRPHGRLRLLIPLRDGRRLVHRRPVPRHKRHAEAANPRPRTHAAAWWRS
jgi:hypothetical protein